MSLQNVNQEDKTQRLAWRYGLSRREIKKCLQFAEAIDSLADRFGQDIRNLLLDRGRRIRLRHSEIIRLAAAVSMHPHRFFDLGDIIRAGNTQDIRNLLRGY